MDTCSSLRKQGVAPRVAHMLNVGQAAPWTPALARPSEHPSSREGLLSSSTCQRRRQGFVTPQPSPEAPPSVRPHSAKLFCFIGSTIWQHLVAISLDSLSFFSARPPGPIQEWAVYWTLNLLIAAFSKPQFWTILPILKSLNTQHFQLAVPVFFSTQGSKKSPEQDLPYETAPQTLHGAWARSTWKLVGSCPNPRTRGRPQRWRGRCCSSNSRAFSYVLSEWLSQYEARAEPGSYKVSICHVDTCPDSYSLQAAFIYVAVKITTREEENAVCWSA